ncbi:hypothetical protein RRG08_030931 [Elysia crispata]|uniref:Uncharacterized protein n=1 Tax=Elysia crispata TaxID=231223 RepID=A0AAE1DVR7_9GAST|nr:hypothetical protein RRG08_030931 [Elysia crispata]
MVGIDKSRTDGGWFHVLSRLVGIDKSRTDGGWFHILSRWSESTRGGRRLVSNIEQDGQNRQEPDGGWFHILSKMVRIDKSRTEAALSNVDCESLAEPILRKCRRKLLLENNPGPSTSGLIDTALSRLKTIHSSMAVTADSSTSPIKVLEQSIESFHIKKDMNTPLTEEEEGYKLFGSELFHGRRLVSYIEQDGRNRQEPDGGWFHILSKMVGIDKSRTEAGVRRITLFHQSSALYQLIQDLDR